MDTFDREAKRLEAELWAAINEGKAKLVLFAKSSRLKGYKTWGRSSGGASDLQTG
jgi:hypothetical protein